MNDSTLKLHGASVMISVMIRALDYRGAKTAIRLSNESRDGELHIWCNSADAYVPVNTVIKALRELYPEEFTDAD